MRTVALVSSALAALLAAGAAPAANIYTAPAGLSGNQAWGGTLGLDFEVLGSITVDQLGAFDSGGDGVSGSLHSAIFDMNGTAVTPLATFAGTAGTGAPYLMQSIAPVTLGAGRYQLASWGYGAADLNYNTYGNNPGPIGFDTLSGTVKALGTRYSGAEAAGQLATIRDDGMTRYGAGTFNVSSFTPAPPPAPPPATVPGPGVYDTASGLAGNQSWTGTLGLNFRVLKDVRITALGAFDDGSDGIKAALRTMIFDAAGVALTPAVSFANALNGTGSSYVFRTLANALVLKPGDYQLASWGYGDTERNYNTYGNNPGPIGFATLGGALAPLGTSYSDPNTGGSFATNPDDGLTRYGAGSMIAEVVTASTPDAVPEPAHWAMLLSGFAFMGAALRRRARPSTAFARA